MKSTTRMGMDRARKALNWANEAFPCVVNSNPALSCEVRALIEPRTLAIASGPGTDFPVTLEGFVTMAVVPQQAQRHGTAITVPGFDETGRRGFLVLQAQQRPYHSRAETSDEAVRQAREALARAAHLEHFFGGRDALVKACRSADWRTWVTMADASDAGLCDWGIECFLRQRCLWFIASRFGLPKFAISLGGRYPQRALAAALVRTGSDGLQNETSSTLTT